jgi:RNA polymerase sigma-70 factor (ECF subfamily)
MPNDLAGAIETIPILPSSVIPGAILGSSSGTRRGGPGSGHPPDIGRFSAEPAESAAPLPAVIDDILDDLRQEVGLGPPAAFLPARKAAPPASDAPGAAAPQSDFARRVAGQFGFLQRSARRWHRDPAHADDLVQDTVALALANAHLWRPDQPDCNLRGWLFAIMRNRFLSGALRARRSDTALDAIAADGECVPVAASLPEARLMMRDVQRALSLLPSRQRNAIRLVGVGGKSYEEAARLMGMTVAALRCHLSRGRERLRDLVDGRAAAARNMGIPSREVRAIDARNGSAKPSAASFPLPVLL